jgi:hypothetical protein
MAIARARLFGIFDIFDSLVICCCKGVVLVDVASFWLYSG